jgi:signal transduction histidine kinase
MTVSEGQRLFSRLFPPVILLAGVLATLFLWRFNREDHDAILQSRFMQETGRIIYIMEEQVRDLSALGLAAQAALGGDAQVNGTAWWRFTAAYDFERNLPAVRALAYVQRAGDSGGEWHAVKFADGVAGGQPLAQNFDMLGLEDWRNASRAAAEDGYDFILEPEEADGVQRLVLPVFETDKPPPTLDQRRAAIKGWVLIDFDLVQLFTGSLGQSAGLLQLLLRLDNGKTYRIDHSGQSDVRVIKRDVSMSGVGFRGRLYFSALPAFEKTFTEDGGQMVLASGAAISLLLSLMVHLLVHGREEALSLATRMSRESLNAAESARIAWQHLSDAIEAIPEGFVLWDSEDRLLLCNSRYREMYSAIAEVLLPGVPFEDVAKAAVERGQHPVVDDEREAWLRRRLEMHRNPSEAHEQHMHDGRWILVSERRTQDGGIVGIRADITGIKQTQAQLVQTSKLATLGEMATGIAHELNQPLTIMRMAGESAAKTLRVKGGEGIEAALDKLDKIIRQIDRAAAITSHMRTFGRKSSGQSEKVDIAQMIEGALSMIGEQLKNRSIDVRLHLEPGLKVRGNSIRLEQVMLNLLGNARDALEARREGEPKWIEVRSGRDASGTMAEINVLDNGGGVDPAILERIFDPFFTTKDPGKGTGLGLSISYGIVSEMDGRLLAENAENGAKFIVTLPLAS